MPGMMDTILNLGLNDKTVEALASATGNGRFAWDSYRRFVQMYGDVVMGVQKRHENEHEPFDEVMDDLKHEARRQGRYPPRRSRPSANWSIASRPSSTNAPARNSPPTPFDQLQGAIGAVFGSWMNERAILYRQKYKIPDEWGTAVNVQSMVFGNMGDDCATGVAFTRDPATGENVFYGEYLVNAQGEDVVAGVRTPKPVSEMAHDPHHRPGLQRTRKGSQDAGEKLRRRAGFRVHDRKEKAVHAANAQRQAHRIGLRENRPRHGQGRLDVARARHPLRRSGSAQSTAPADFRSRRLRAGQEPTAA